jgi:hypothetical protein
MYVTQSSFGLMVADASDLRAQWAELDELEQSE